MGVQGLWSILNCSGKEIDLSILDGKVLAVDLSIWLNQALKSSNESPNAHLQILFNRICKLLFYKIKPVFVFDGPTPSIKRHALAVRRRARQLKNDRTEQIKLNIMNILMKKNLIQKKRKPNTKVKEQNDIFQLPNETSELINNWRPDLDSEFSEIAVDYIRNFSSIDDVDVTSQSFYSLPLEVQHEVLRTVSKEKRYGLETNQDSYCEMNSKDFSGLQIQRLLNRNNLHQRVDELKSTMNNRDCRKILDSSKLPCLTDLSYASVSAKRIISQDHGYLMLIDSYDNDLINSLSESKREAMLKHSKIKSEETNNEILSVEDNRYLCDESESTLNERELSDVMKCVSKLKKMSQGSESSSDGHSQPNINNLIKEYISTSDGHSQINVSNLAAADDMYIANDSSHNLETNVEIDFIEIENVMSISPNVMSSGDIISTKSILEESEELTIIKLSENSDSFQDSESDSDFIDVPVTEEQNKDKQEFEKTELEKSIDHNKMIFSSLNESEILSKLNSSDDSLDLNKCDQIDIHDIITDAEAWNASVDVSLSQLYAEERKLEHQSVSISEHYFQEAKELLSLFGIPFVESPAEAEAQCAFLEIAGLTDGTITEDSDIWLFGGKRVYKHMFSRGFSVKEYNSENIYKKLSLNRDLMICIALLSGGDYTPGIYGVGPVNAIEILAEFSDLEVPMTNFQVLESFKKWSDDHKNDENYTGNPERKRFLRFELENNFPDLTAYEAYNKALVDESKEAFIWSAPSTDKLIEYVHTKIGWEKLKIIEMLQIALQSGTKSTVSLTKITDFFDASVTDGHKLPSKRLKQAAKQRNLLLKHSLNKRKKH